MGGLNGAIKIFMYYVSDPMIRRMYVLLPFSAWFPRAFFVGLMAFVAQDYVPYKIEGIDPVPDANRIPIHVLADVSGDSNVNVKAGSEFETLTNLCKKGDGLQTILKLLFNNGYF